MDAPAHTDSPLSNTPTPCSEGVGREDVKPDTDSYKWTSAMVSQIKQLGDLQAVSKDTVRHADELAQQVFRPADGEGVDSLRRRLSRAKFWMQYMVGVTSSARVGEEEIRDLLSELDSDLQFLRAENSRYGRALMEATKKTEAMSADIDSLEKQKETLVGQKYLAETNYDKLVKDVAAGQAIGPSSDLVPLQMARENDQLKAAQQLSEQRITLLESELVQAKMKLARKEEELEFLRRAAAHLLPAVAEPAALAVPLGVAHLQVPSPRLASPSRSLSIQQRIRAVFKRPKTPDIE